MVLTMGSITSLDIKIAFLQGELEEEFCIELPLDFRGNLVLFVNFNVLFMG